MDEDWEPWVQHDGRGCPVPAGTIVEVVCEDCFGYSRHEVGRTDGSSYSSWDWSFYPELQRIVRYRKKKPRGMQVLREALKRLDALVPASRDRVFQKA